MPRDEPLPYPLYLRFPDRSAQGHAVEPLFGGEAVFGAMLAAIGSARREVLVELSGTGEPPEVAAGDHPGTTHYDNFMNPA